jgi:hypothetical protein
MERLMSYIKDTCTTVNQVSIVMVYTGFVVAYLTSQILFLEYNN